MKVLANIVAVYPFHRRKPPKMAVSQYLVRNKITSTLRLQTPSTIVNSLFEDKVYRTRGCAKAAIEIGSKRELAITFASSPLLFTVHPGWMRYVRQNTVILHSSRGHRRKTERIPLHRPSLSDHPRATATPNCRVFPSVAPRAPCRRGGRNVEGAYSGEEPVETSGR